MLSIGDGTLPHLYAEPSLLKCTSVQWSKIFKQNWNISIRSNFITFNWFIGSPWLWVGWWMWVCGEFPMHACMHVYAHICAHPYAHACDMHACVHTCTHMIISYKWLCPWRNPWRNSMMSYTCACAMHVFMCVHICVHTHAWIHGALLIHSHPPTPTSTHPPTHSQGGPPNQLKLDINSVGRFEICGDFLTWVIGLMDGLMWNH